MHLVCVSAVSKAQGVLANHCSSHSSVQKLFHKQTSGHFPQKPCLSLEGDNSNDIPDMALQKACKVVWWCLDLQ